VFGALRAIAGRFAARRALVAAAVALGSLCWVAQADAFVYWTNSNTNMIGRSSLDGTSVNQRFIRGASGPYGVAAYGNYIYWTNRSANAIGRAKLNGTSVDQHFISATGPQGIAVDGHHIYCTTATDAIGRAKLNGTSVDQSFIAGASAPDALAVAGSYIYWTNSARITTIGRATLAGADVNEKFISLTQHAYGVAVDLAAGLIFWTDLADNRIGRASLNGTHVDPGFILTDAPLGITVSGHYLYWSTSITTLGRATVNGHSAESGFITGAAEPLGVTVAGASG
jgi:virginiamycin B lyase